MINSTLTSKVRFTFRDISDGECFCLDLLQALDGERAVALRLSGTAQHEMAVRTSAPISAERLKIWLARRATSDEILTTLGEQFALDAHNSCSC